MQESGSNQLERQDRLKEWFKDNPKEWQDVKIDFNEYLDMQTQKLISPIVASRERDFIAGICRGIKWCLEVDDYYLELIDKEKEDAEQGSQTIAQKDI